MDQIAKVTVEALDQESIAPMVFELKNFIMSQHRCSDAWHRTQAGGAWSGAGSAW